MEHQALLDCYFLQDGAKQANGSYKKSVLLSLERDLAFCILLPRVWKDERSSIKLSEEQYRLLQQQLPTFTVISLFCTAVDTLGRLALKTAIPPLGKNKTFFIESSVNWFGLTGEEAAQLWVLRNGISHSYRISDVQGVRQYGYSGIIRHRNDGVWEFYLHAMHGSLRRAKELLYNHLSNENADDIQLTANYLQENGFFYTV